MIGKVKKQIFSSLVTYINLSGVFHTHSRVSNNQGVIIICFVQNPTLKMLLGDRVIVSFIFNLHARLFHSGQSFGFKLKRNTIGILCC